MSAQGSGIDTVVQHELNSKTLQTANVQPATGGEQQFRTGTSDMLNEVRDLVENAVGQGQDISPMVYQMLGLQPQFEDNSQDLNAATQQHQQVQQQFQQAQDRVSQLTAIPGGKRTPAQRKELRQLNKQLPTLRSSLNHAQATLGQLQTMPKRITGITRMDPSAIPAESPFSANNPLNQIQQQYQKTLDSALKGDYPVDPTLAHEYARQEQALRSRLAAQYGPDYENSSVGQMALQAFGKTKADAFATYNRQIVDQYSNLAFSGAANLQSLLSGQIGLMREPENTQLQGAASLANATIPRMTQEDMLQKERFAKAGVQQSTTQMPGPIGLGAAALQTGAGAYGAKTIADALSGNQQPTGPTASDLAGASAGNIDMSGNPATFTPTTTGAGSGGTPSG